MRGPIGGRRSEHAIPDLQGVLHPLACCNQLGDLAVDGVEHPLGCTSSCAIRSGNITPAIRSTSRADAAG
jgi:hypothetical protein